MRETILINALEKIEKILLTGFIENSREIATKALTDWASAPKEGQIIVDFLEWMETEVEVIKEENITLYRHHSIDGWGNYVRDDIVTEFLDKYDPEFSPSSAPESGGEEKDAVGFVNYLVENNYQKFEDKFWVKDNEDGRFTLDYLYLVYKDFVPSVQSSDVKPVASHSYTSSNSIEEIIAAYDEYIKVLDDELNDTVGMASIHGWQSRNVLRGEQAREKIAKVKASLDSSLSKEEGKDELTDYGKAVRMAKRFHELYEEYAPLYGYETRKETRDFNEDSPNGKLMISVCEQLQKETGLKGEDND